MVFEQWNKISYMVQLLGACLLIMLPSYKRSNWLLRYGVFLS